jgi:hypothetical protein
MMLRFYKGSTDLDFVDEFSVEKFMEQLEG